MGKWLYICLHTLDVPYDMVVTKGMIDRWHMGPKDIQENGKVKYMGKIYESRKDLPDERLGDVPIRNMHGRGWDRVGYHEIFHKSGSIEILTDINDDNWINYHEMTWGAAGINAKAVHWALEGGWTKEGKKNDIFDFFDLYNDAQYTNLEFQLKATLGLHTHLKVMGHNHVSSKTCPNFNVEFWMKKMLIPEENIYKS